MQFPLLPPPPEGIGIHVAEVSGLIAAVVASANGVELSASDDASSGPASPVEPSEAALALFCCDPASLFPPVARTLPPHPAAMLIKASPRTIPAFAMAPFFDIRFIASMWEPTKSKRFRGRCARGTSLETDYSRGRSKARARALRASTRRLIASVSACLLVHHGAFTLAKRPPGIAVNRGAPRPNTRSRAGRWRWSEWSGLGSPAARREWPPR